MHHVIGYFSNLNVSAPYTRPDTLTMGNGASLPITHLGASTIPTESGIAFLNNILFVPSDRKNLLSVRTFCHDNNALVSFDAFGFVIKHRSTNQILFRGQTDEGLYCIYPLSFSKRLAAFFFIASSSHSSSCSLPITYLGV